MDRNTIIKGGIVAGTLLGIGLLQYYMLKIKPSASHTFESNYRDTSSNNSESEVVTTPKTVAPKIAKSATATQSSVFPLKIGAKGNEVTQLQMYLLKHHGWAAVTMGTYDKLTEQRVRQFLKVPQVNEVLYKQLIPNPIKTQ